MIADNLGAVVLAIQDACRKVGRRPSEVKLIAVSKTFSKESVLEAIEAGQVDFGESKLQEAEPKISCVPGSVHWHFIGRVQRNKVRKILQNFEMIHAIDSLRLATFADEIALELGSFPKVFLQVDIGDQLSKGGFSSGELRDSFEDLLNLERLQIQGLMCIPPVGPDSETARPWFAALRVLRNDLEARFGVELPSLSMGMSNDYQVAIEEGATHVRVGSAIFGKRSYRVDGELG